MINQELYLRLAKKAVKDSLVNMNTYYYKNKKESFDKKYPKEIKAEIDISNNSIIRNILSKSNIPILSEESYDKSLLNKKSLVWIVDPLDGTLNYIRKISSSAVSIALFDGNVPIFGIIGEFPEGRIIYGGPKIKSFFGKKILSVSKKKSMNQGVLCTGFPSRYNFNKNLSSKLFKFYSKFLKVRMLGSAAISLLKVAEGSVEAYYEEEIMLWDVGAGLAILIGAGGKYEIKKGETPFSLRVFAHNGNIKHD